MLKITNLFKTYKRAKKPALRGLSLDVKDGEVFGLVGKNGAGKSTTIKCITGILPFEKGQILINSLDIVTQECDAKNLIGYVPDNHTVYENLTGREYVNFMADIYGVSEKDRVARLNKYAEMFNLTDSIDMQINGYSHGMHQKICIIGALIHEPKLWILDEPFLGLDIVSIEHVKKCIQDYSKNKNHMVIFSSHNLEMVAEICDKVCVIENGVVKEVLDLHKKNNIEKPRIALHP